MEISRQDAVAVAEEVLRVMADALSERADNPESSVPQNARHDLLAALAIVKTWGPVVAYERDNAESGAN